MCGVAAKRGEVVLPAPPRMMNNDALHPPPLHTINYHLIDPSTPTLLAAHETYNQGARHSRLDRELEDSTQYTSLEYTLKVGGFESY